MHVGSSIVVALWANGHLIMKTSSEWRSVTIYGQSPLRLDKKLFEPEKWSAHTADGTGNGCATGTLRTHVGIATCICRTTCLKVVLRSFAGGTCPWTRRGLLHPVMYPRFSVTMLHRMCRALGLCSFWSTQVYFGAFLWTHLHEMQGVCTLTGCAGHFPLEWTRWVGHRSDWDREETNPAVCSAAVWPTCVSPAKFVVSTSIRYAKIGQNI